MKKILVLSVLIATFLSCSNDDPYVEEFHFEILPIESVTMPDEMQYGEVYTINYTYYKPSSCHLFSDLYYQSEANYRTIAVINTVLNEVDGVICEPLTNELVEKSFVFLCENNSGQYVFKFWQGENENGEDTYLVFEVPIGN